MPFIRHMVSDGWWITRQNLRKSIAGHHRRAGRILEIEPRQAPDRRDAPRSLELVDVTEPGCGDEALADERTVGDSAA